MNRTATCWAWLGGSTTACRWLADAVLVSHFAFIVFATFGALAVWRWPRLAWLHLPALAWAAYVVLAGEVCPLTPLENALRQAAGEEGYRQSFIEHYLLPLVYPQAVQGEMGRGVQTLLGLALLLLNAAVYAALLRRRRHRNGKDAPRNGLSRALRLLTDGGTPAVPAARRPLQEISMRRKQPSTPPSDDYPSALAGGEPRKEEHRIGETERHSPRADDVDPAGTQPDPGSTEPKQTGSDPRG